MIERDDVQGICPLMSYQNRADMPQQCYKDGCMWWDKEEKACLVKCLATIVREMEGKE